MVSRLSRSLALACAGLWLGSAALAQVKILGKSGSYSTIQSAVDAAADKDVVVLDDGLQYAGFTIQAKSLTILAQNPDSVAVLGACRIEGIAAEGTVALVDMVLRNPSGSALTLVDSPGQILIQDCTLFAGTSGGTHAGLEAFGCQRVLLQRSEVQGSDYGQASGLPPQPGGDGVLSVDSCVIAYHTKVKGGDGSDSTTPEGGAGGAGARVSGWGFFAGAAQIDGGQGGDGDYLGCTISGNGGDGIVLTAAQAFLLDDATYHSGEPGSFYTCTSGSPGTALMLLGGSIVNRPPVIARGFDGPDWTFEGTSSFYKVLGKPGDTVWILRAPAGSWEFQPKLAAWAACALPSRVTVTPVGVLGPSGALTVPLEFPDLSGALVNSVWSMQTLTLDIFGKISLSAPHHVVVVNL
jgi:hypothetical protein